MTIDPLFQAILDSPADAFLKTVYADFLQDEGMDKEAKAWRWIARNGKYPIKSKHWEQYDWFTLNNSSWMGFPEHCKVNSWIIWDFLVNSGIYKTQLEA